MVEVLTKVEIWEEPGGSHGGGCSVGSYGGMMADGRLEDDSENLGYSS